MSWVEDVAVSGGFIALYTCIVCIQIQIQIIFSTFQGLLNYYIAKFCVHTFRFRLLGLKFDWNCKYESEVLIAVSPASPWSLQIQGAQNQVNWEQVASMGEEM